MVVPKPDAVLTEEALCSFCGERLARFKVSGTIQLVCELPKTGSSRILITGSRRQFL